jgi:histidinol-phosphate aminotransferase
LIPKLKIERERLYKKLNKIPDVKAFPSDANFVLFTTEQDSAMIHHTLMSHGILIRTIENILHYSRCFRVTVGLPEMNKKFLTIMQELCSS